jgi:hypothetical protein
MLYIGVRPEPLWIDQDRPRRPRPVLSRASTSLTHWRTRCCCAEIHVRDVDED